MLFCFLLRTIFLNTLNLKFLLILSSSIPIRISGCVSRIQRDSGSRRICDVGKSSYKNDKTLTHVGFIRIWVGENVIKFFIDSIGSFIKSFADKNSLKLLCSKLYVVSMLPLEVITSEYRKLV